VILVDSSVWVDYFRGVDTAEADKLDTFLGVEQILTGDLILTEVLQGFISDREFNQGKKLLASLPMVPLVGEEIAVQVARNFRKLRALGITVRKTFRHTDRDELHRKENLIVVQRSRFRSVRSAPRPAQRQLSSCNQNGRKCFYHMSQKIFNNQVIMVGRGRFRLSLRS
jgi:predicted nucleic acid-binding protein